MPKRIAKPGRRVTADAEGLVAGPAATAGKIPVGKQPICSRRELAAIDPLWVFGRVPMRFWEERENRRNYLLWLAHKLRYRTMEDYYRLTRWEVRRYLEWLGQTLGFRTPDDWLRVRREDFVNHHGRFLVRKAGSFFGVLEEFLPQLDWASRRNLQSRNNPGRFPRQTPGKRAAALRGSDR